MTRARTRTHRLGSVQRWLQALIVDPRPARLALRARSVRRHLAVDAEHAAEVVLPSRTLTPLERIDIYGGMYFARLADALAADYPVLHEVLGEHRFHHLACDYVRAFPSRHPNLSFLGARLPDFIARGARLPGRRFLAELARLEWAMAESFMAPECGRLEQKDLDAVPADRWGDVVLGIAPHVRLLAAKYPVNRFLQALKVGKSPARPRPAARHVAVYRKDDRVWRMDLSPPMHSVLAALGDGLPLAQAVARAPRAGAALTGWFRGWMSEGFFEKILPSRPAVAGRDGAPRRGGRPHGGASVGSVPDPDRRGQRR